MPGIFISLAISFLLFLYAPVDLYCANVSEFWFDFSTLLITALGMFAACFAVLAVLYLIAMLIIRMCTGSHWPEELHFLSAPISRGIL